MTTPITRNLPSWAAAASVAHAAAAGPTPVPGDSDEAYQRYVTLIDAQIKSSQKTLATQNARLASLKKMKGSTAAAKKKIAQQINLQTNLIKATTAKLNMQQTSKVNKTNQYYKDTGQYSKLLEGANRDAFMAIESLFKGYGLESLAGKIYDYVKNGYSGDTISILLQDTPEYKTRFSGNEARKAAGLPVLSPGEYLSTESSYRQIMQQAGLPVGYYDQPSDFANWIGKDVSPTEIQTRVDLATQATVLANPAYKQALNQMGIDDAHLTAYFLDTTKALPFVQKAAATAAIGAQALATGLGFDQSYAEQLATAGVTQDQAKQGYQDIAQASQTMNTLGKIYGEAWNQRTSEQLTFEGNAEAAAKKGRLLSQERGSFSGSGGGAKGLGGLTQAGGAQ
jgi:hypothetical protein